MGAWTNPRMHDGLHAESRGTDWRYLRGLVQNRTANGFRHSAVATPATATATICGPMYFAPATPAVISNSGVTSAIDAVARTFVN